MINQNIHKRIASTLVLSLAFLTIFSGFILSSPEASADSSANANISVIVPSVCSLTADPDTLSKTITQGNSALIGSTNIKALCNDPAGLAVYAVGFTNNSYGNNKLVYTVGANNLEIRSYVTPSDTTPSQSEWNMTLSPVSGSYTPTIVSTFENTANVIPTEYTKVAYRNSATDMGSNADGTNFAAAFKAYIAEDQAAGTYTGKVKFLLMHPNIIDSSTTPATQRPNTVTTMQGVASWKADLLAMPVGTTKQALDIRDDTIYTVAKLADGKIWMIQNLRLDFEHADITAANTNNPTSDFLNAYSTVKPNNAGGSWKNSAHATGADAINYDTSNIGVTTIDDLGHSYDEYGVYYNYYAATAGNSIYYETSADPAGDICPYGWHLPSGSYDNDTEYEGLYSASVELYGNGNLLNPPANFVLSGSIGNGNIDNRNVSGFYWTGSINGQYSAYTRQISGTSGSYTRTYFEQNWGYMVRCVAN